MSRVGARLSRREIARTGFLICVLTLAATPLFGQTKFAPPDPPPGYTPVSIGECKKAQQGLSLSLSTTSSSGADPHWIVTGPTGTVSPYHTTFSSWTALSAMWVQPAQSSSVTPSSAAEGKGPYTYTIWFDLPCPLDSYKKLTLKGLLAADDYGTIYLNTTLLGACSNCAAVPATFGAGSGFKQGINSLSVVVGNDPASYTGIAVGASLSATCTGACKAPTLGMLKICKVAGVGVTAGTPFNFTISTSTSHAVLSVPAGPAPGGTCMIGPSYPVGTQVAVTEAASPGNTVSSIDVAPQSQLVSANLSGGGVTIKVGAGITEVTYTDRRSGFLEICKKGEVKGNFSFMVDPGGLGPFAVPAGACSSAIEVAAGSVTIHELTAGANIIACSTIPAGMQGSCNMPQGSQNSVVTVVAGDISSMTIAFIGNETKACTGPNLVPNPSFETQSACPTGYSQLPLASPWTPAHAGSPDYFHTCAAAATGMGAPGNDFGNQTPRTGQGYAGLNARPVNLYREYIEAPLTSPLVAGRTYEVSFYVSLADQSQWAVNQMGAFFSVGPVPNTGSYVLGVTPQVSYTGGYLQNKSGWTLISGTFVAVGGEDHLVIGNFADNPATPTLTGQGGAYPFSYYYVDDVSANRCN